MKTSNFYISNQTVQGNLLPIYKSKILTVPHGFSSRAGGFSTLAHLSSLNMGYDIGDTNETVNHNRSIFASAALEQPIMYDRIISARQIHSATVSYVTEKDIGRSDFALDGFVTDKK